MTEQEPTIRVGHDDEGQRIYRLTSERKRLRQIDDGDSRERIAEIDAELEELGVQRVPDPSGEDHGPAGPEG